MNALTLVGFRGVREGSIRGLRPLTVLTGPNGSGKSALLDALLLGASEDVRAAAETVRSRHPLVGDPDDWLFYAGTRSMLTTIEVDGRAVRLERYQNRVPVLRIRTDRGEVQLGDPQNPVDTRVGGRNAGVPCRLVDPGLPTSLNDAWSQVVRGGDVAKQRVFGSLRSIVSDAAGLELVLDARGQPALHVSYEDRSVPLALAGDGVQAAVQILLHLALVPTGGLALLEEPEVYQHPRTLQHTASVIAETVRRGVQVICTTHSLELIDELVAAHGADDMAVVNLRLDQGVLTSSVLTDAALATARDGGFLDLR